MPPQRILDEITFTTENGTLRSSADYKNYENAPQFYPGA